MTSRSDLRERPPSGEYEWPNNGEINERLRVGLLEQAIKAEAAGDVAAGRRPARQGRDAAQGA